VWMHLLMIPLLAFAVWGEQLSSAADRELLGPRALPDPLRTIAGWAMPLAMISITQGRPSGRELAVVLLVLAAAAVGRSGYPGCPHCREMAGVSLVMALLVALPASGARPVVEAALVLLVLLIAAMIWSVRTSLQPSPMARPGDRHGHGGDPGAWLIGRISSQLAGVVMVLALI
jgi:hypothetical protein